MKKNGVTLVELIVTTAIIGIIMTPISFILYSMFREFNVESDKIMAQQVVRNAMDIIMLDLRRYGGNDTNVLDINTLNIESGLQYIFEEGKLKKVDTRGKNITFIILASDEAKTVEFSSSSDNNLINITLSVQYKNSEIIKIQNSYRKKVELTPT